MGVELDIDADLDALPGDGRADTTIVVRAGRGDPPPVEHWIGDHDWPMIARDDERMVLEFADDVTFSFRPAALLLEYWMHRDLDRETFTHELADAAIPRCLATMGRHVLHGSSVAIDGKAVLFLGASGAGKSTTAAAMVAAGAELVTDDAAPLLAGPDGSILVVPSQTNLRLYEHSAEVLGDVHLGPAMADWSNKRLLDPRRNDLPTATAPVRLVAVMSLEVSEGDTEPTLVSLADSEVFETLARNSFDLPDESPMAGLTVLDRWRSIAGAIDGYRLQRPLDLDRIDETVRLVRSVLASA